ncbi:MAG: hypothetical protein OCC45_13955 [Desulfotalea sp.]
MIKMFPWWLSALLGVIIYPCFTYLPVYFTDAANVTFFKNAAPIICLGLFLYGAFAIYDAPGQDKEAQKDTPNISTTEGEDLKD